MDTKFNVATTHISKLAYAEKALAREQEKNQQLREAMQEFVDRCDRGEVRSRYTYNKFKDLLK